MPYKVRKSNFVAKFLQQKYLQIMVLLGIAWMMVFSYAPLYGLVIAFKDYKITKPIADAAWVGLKHFKDFFGDERFAEIMINTLGISILKLLICFPIPILFAILLNELPFERFKKLTQTITYLPHFLSWVVLGGILINWLSDTGIINTLLVKAGIIKSPIFYLGDAKYFWGVVVLSDLWKELGWSAIIYLAAIAGIDQSLYEAATVDGANRIQRIKHITLPCIKATIALLFILTVSGLLNSNFDQVLVLKNSLNETKSTVIDIYVYQMGIRANRPSYATAIGLYKSVIALMLLLSANWFTNKLNKE